jgi:hypothetical protein
VDRERLDAAIQKIRDYTRAHPDLQAAHHFLFDLPLDKGAGTPEVVVMGINPGEVDSQWQQVPGPTEETWSHNFHDAIKRSQSSRRWHNNALFFSNQRPVVFTELFFWSAKNGDHFKKRFGELWRSPHLKFCVSMNRLLLEEYNPEMVIFTGIMQDKDVSREFDLSYIRTYRHGEKRLVEHYKDRRRPWFFTRHWSSDRGLSQAEKLLIKEYMQAHTLN